jgi:ABC-type dipeptide/oligopeptide/nickel transport system permease subunit
MSAARALRHRSFAVGAVLAALLVAAAALSLVWTPWPPYEIDMAMKLRAPSAEHWLGTDSLGRDVASLLLVGARNSILVGVIAVGIGLAAGVAFGLVAAARRGWVEEAVMRVADFTFAFPAVLSAIMMTAVFGPGIVNSIIAIGIFNVPVFARVTRASANAIWAREFVLAARAAGKGRMRITLEHVLPNIASVLIVRARDPRRGRALVPGPGHPAAAAVVGAHAERGADADVLGTPAGGVSGRGDRAVGARSEPARRRAARPARPAPGARAVGRRWRSSKSST